jgi:phosphate transport system substrate-binding protein
MPSPEVNPFLITTTEVITVLKTQNLLAVSVATAVSLAAANVQARTEIQNKGSDTLVNVAQTFAEEYAKINPEVAIAVSGGGSGTGIAAMINGTVDIANSSRKMKDKEIKLAEEHGQHPVEHVVGYDALAIYVHKDNPADTMTLADLAKIYGRDGGATKWEDLGITVPGCTNGEIVVVSRQNNSGTYAYFQEAVLGEKGKYRMGTLDMHGSKDVVDLVEKTPCAIGYSGLAYATDHVKTVCLSSEAGKPCVMPSEDAALDGSYPIARPLFMYTNGKPQGEIKNYMDWIMSDTGQCLVAKEGYAPVRKLDCN